MPTAVKILIMLFRLVWLIGLALGIWIWTGHGYSMLRMHIGLGFCTVLLLALVAVLGAVARAGVGRVFLAILWVVLLPIAGFGQLSPMAGAQHWVFRVVHLVIGVAAIGSAEMLAAKAVRRGRGRELA